MASDKLLHELIYAGDLAALEQWAASLPDFPPDAEDARAEAWITLAIKSKNFEVISWMISKGVPVNFKETHGYPALHSALDTPENIRYEIMELLIQAGADLNGIGMHWYTPAHLAACRNDVRALEILHHHSADFSIRTGIDDYATPLEEARDIYGEKAKDAITYLEMIENGI